jgi:hypothetical protein
VSGGSPRTPTAIGRPSVGATPSRYVHFRTTRFVMASLSVGLPTSGSSRSTDSIGSPSPRHAVDRDRPAEALLATLPRCRPRSRRSGPTCDRTLIGPSRPRHDAVSARVSRRADNECLPARSRGRIALGVPMVRPGRVLPAAGPPLVTVLKSLHRLPSLATAGSVGNSVLPGRAPRSRREEERIARSNDSQWPVSHPADIPVLRGSKSTLPVVRTE